jgi:hypothetical protein
LKLRDGYGEEEGGAGDDPLGGVGIAGSSKPGAGIAEGALGLGSAEPFQLAEELIGRAGYLGSFAFGSVGTMISRSPTGAGGLAGATVDESTNAARSGA